MRTRFRIIAIFTLLMLLLGPSLFAGGQPDTAVSNEEITLQYWSWDPEMKGRNEKMIDKFEAANPGITV